MALKRTRKLGWTKPMSKMSQYAAQMARANQHDHAAALNAQVDQAYRANLERIQRR